MWNDVTTRSPGATAATASPTATTVPTASWPMTVPGSIGAFPWKKCRSDPQMPACDTRRIASPGSSIAGSGTVATSTTPSLRKTTARIYASSGNSVSIRPVSRTSSFAAFT